MRQTFFTSLLLLISGWNSACLAFPQWTPEHAREWYTQQGWRVGSNYIPADAVNSLEMWQAPTFNPARINLELSWAESIGLTSMRVFLHDLPWNEDATAFTARIDSFLRLCASHHIKPVLVLFDSCWNPTPHSGLQPSPVPGVHNSGWVQSPGLRALTDPHEKLRLKSYVQGIISTFAKDPRILAWDLWNEPDNLNSSSYHDPETKIALVESLLPQVFAWARDANPEQPLTSGVWSGDWSKRKKLTLIQQTQLESSDIISFHHYGKSEDVRKAIMDLSRYQRPLFLTEYMARPLGSTLQSILPLLKSQNVSAFNWGFVAGKTQTYFPWDSWQHPYTTLPPVWFHDLFYSSGKPYRDSEIEFLKQETKVQRLSALYPRKKGSLRAPRPE